MEFIEFPAFTDAIDELLTREEQRALQLAMLLRPEAGPVIKGSGGLRKLRWRVAGSGKRGGIRVIYYLQHEETFYMLFAYQKNKQEDLTRDQLKTLRKLMKDYIR